MSSKLDAIQKFQPLLTPDGRSKLANVFAAYREAYGEAWLAEFKARNPDYVFLVDLVANRDFANAYVALKGYVADRINEAEPSPFKRIALQGAATLWLDGSRNELEVLHGFLKAEIDRPRL